MLWTADEDMFRTFGSLGVLITSVRNLKSEPEISRHWTGFFEQLHRSDLPACELVTVVVGSLVICDPPDVK